MTPLKTSSTRTGALVRDLGVAGGCAGGAVWPPGPVGSGLERSAAGVSCHVTTEVCGPAPSTSRRPKGNTSGTPRHTPRPGPVQPLPAGQCCQIGPDFTPNLATLAAARCTQGLHIGREIWPNLATLAAGSRAPRGRCPCGQRSPELLWKAPSLSCWLGSRKRPSQSSPSESDITGTSRACSADVGEGDREEGEGGREKGR